MAEEFAAMPDSASGLTQAWKRAQAGLLRLAGCFFADSP